MKSIKINAEPEAISLEIAKTALIIIDMQRDFLQQGGFGAALGNDVTQLHSAIAPCQALLTFARKNGMFVIHTREGHRPDLSDAPPAKLARGKSDLRIGSQGPMGRILVIGEMGQDIIPELYPITGEPVIDKPGKGAFYATDLGCILQNKEIKYLIICGVTTEICVHTTVREANDRGYQCIVPGDCCASYFPEFHQSGLNMIKAQGGILGSVTTSKDIIQATDQ